MQPDITAPGVNILGAWSPVSLVANWAVTRTASYLAHLLHAHTSQLLQKS